MVRSLPLKLLRKWAYLDFFRHAVISASVTRKYSATNTPYTLRRFFQHIFHPSNVNASITRTILNPERMNRLLKKSLTSMIKKYLLRASTSFILYAHSAESAFSVMMNCMLISERSTRSALFVDDRGSHMSSEPYSLTSSFLFTNSYPRLKVT
jgi:hypothetical protein